MPPRAPPRHALLRGAHTTAADGEGEFVSPLLSFSLLACTSEPLPVPEEGPAQVGHQEESVGRDKILNWSRTTHDPFAGAWEEPWPPELIQGDHSEPHPMEPHLPKEAV